MTHQNSNDLAEPLITVAALHESLQRDELLRRRQEEDGFAQHCRRISLEDLEAGVEDECREEAARQQLQSAFCRDTIVIFVVLPALLALQFYLALIYDTTTALDEALSPLLNMPLVVVSIALFVLSSWLYRRTLQECDSCFMLLLPEVCMDVVLAVLLYGNALLGLQVMLCSMLIQATIVVACNLYLVFCQKASNQDNDELDVGYFKGGRQRR